ncbi:uncharacterized protein I206_107354 [Kwoniella pini CBS 10737]|uniref:ATP-dependent DNA ligase family profile domain-containing protein n=1 Tax=Kwoniella pini CBS 10737 TaxID=1296096 RepID=A0A1B9HX34_9TREE|nr:uncharacterized protein I206_05681 [Kwoniella pini CBS 10737]OCF47821.1 hypothetical protein I206_05681 [Kwoniella pini CBS 10737]
MLRITTLLRPAVRSRSLFGFKSIFRPLSTATSSPPAATAYPKAWVNSIIAQQKGFGHAAITVEDEKLTIFPDYSYLSKHLSRVAELQDRVAAENSRTGKTRIIGEYPDLKELLEYIYNPTLRNNLTYPNLKKWIKTDGDISDGTMVPWHLLDLFDLLSSRRITGNNAKELTYTFLVMHHISKDQKLMDIFGKLLDRNLLAGFGANTLKEVKWQREDEVDAPVFEPVLLSNAAKPMARLNPSSSASPISPSKSSTSSFDNHTTLISSRGKTPIHPKTAKLDKFEVALGKSLEPPFESLFKDGSVWYASRKLDGVRCLTFLDFLVPTNSSEAMELVSVHFVSRTGKPFNSLSKLEEQLQPLSKLPVLRKWLDVDPLLVEERPDGVVKRLILDGEVCVMRPKTSEELATSQARDDGSVADSMWIANDPFVEDFSSTVSQMRRSDTINHPSYFLFDVLSYSELNAKTSLQGHEGLGKKFGARLRDIKFVGAWLSDCLDEKGVKEKMFKDLKQIKVAGVADVEVMVDRAAREGWEGIILRKDEGYKGKRSPDIRKFKKWQDAEYKVESLDISPMRLAVNGVFGEHNALANVWINHDGHSVSVGSGFTADQRMRYAKYPEQIIGKYITVEYFGESDSMERDKKANGAGKKSLRFPRIKMVWEEGKRGM